MTAAPVTRFAPSPNGPLHMGHAFSALFGAREAQRAGAAELPEPLKRLMALSGRLMTTVAHRV